MQSSMKTPSQTQQILEFLKSHWSNILNSANISCIWLPVLLANSYVYSYIVFCMTNFQATWIDIFAYVT